MKSIMFRRTAALLLAAVLTIPMTGTLAAEPSGDPPPAESVAPAESPVPSESPGPTYVLKSIYLDHEGKTLEQGEGLELTALPVFDPAPQEGEPAPAFQPTWSSSNPSVAEVTAKGDEGIVVVKSPGVTTITAAVGEVSASCEVTVSGLTLEATSLNLYVNEAKALAFERFGSVSDTEVVWESSNVSVAEVDKGKVVAYYPGETVLTAKVGIYEAKCTVTVKEDVAEVIKGQLDSRRLLSFADLADTLKSRCRTKTGEELSRITGLVVPAREGLLCYNYISTDAPGHGVGGGESYYVTPPSGQMGLDNVTFVPQSEFTGTAQISYTGYSTSGLTFNGTIQIQVETAKDVSYHSGLGRPVSFAAEDFRVVCRARTGRAVNYLTFEQPPEREGRLYRNYSVSGEYAQAVGPEDRIQMTDAVTGELVAFVPAEGFSGTVTVPYRCVDTSGSSFTGKVTIIVRQEETLTEENEVRLEVREGKALALKKDAFNRVCQTVNGRQLRSIRFLELPGSNQGVLYYDYDSKNETRVSTKTHYYSSGNPYLTHITFLPASGFSGTVRIPFVGTDDVGHTFDGILHIEVGTSLEETRTITYYTLPGQTVDFESEDFDWVCRTITGNSLDYVRFSLPDSWHGHLYYDEWSSTHGVFENTNYYRKGTKELLDNVYYQPPNKAGTFYVDFRGWDVHRQQFKGKVAIVVSDPEAAVVRVMGSSLPIPLRTADFQTACRAAAGGELRSIRFLSLPAPESGALYMDGRKLVSSHNSYSVEQGELDRLSFVARAGYEGVIRLSYEGLGNRGRSFSGTLEITISNLYCPTSFPDMLLGWEWARPSVEYLHQQGVVNGCEVGSYCPQRNVSRGEYTAMVCRAFGFTSTAVPGFADVPMGSYYGPDIAAAREHGLLPDVGELFRPNEPILRQDAFLMLDRALRASGRGLPLAPDSSLFRFTDVGVIPAEARPALAALAQAGVIRGNELAQLLPFQPISRAEIAVILHRGLTL